MRKRTSLQRKMIIYFVPVIVIIFGGLIGYITNQARVNLLEDTRKRTNAVAEKYANIIGGELNNDAHITKGVAHAFNSFDMYTDKQRTSIYNKIIREVMVANRDFVSLWVNFELKYIDSTYTKNHGRISITFIRYPNGSISQQMDTLEVDKVTENNFYNRVKKTKKETLVNPAYFSYTGHPEDEVLKTTYCVPLLKNGNFAGLAGIDLDLDRYEKLMKEIDVDKGGYAFLVANNGVIFTHPEKELTGKQYGNVYPQIEKQFQVTEYVNRGEFLSFEHVNKRTGEKGFFSFVPITVANTTTPWSIGFYVPFSAINQKAKQMIINAGIFSFIGLLILAAVIIFLSKRITKPLTETTRVIKKLSEGEVDDELKLEVKSGDEMEEMAISLNHLVEGLNQTTHFARSIGEGDLESEYKLLGDNDVLGTSLLDMRKNLLEARKQEEKRKAEDEKLNWATQGEARFGEILRQYSNNINDLSMKLLTYLVNYVDAIQGGVFVKMDDEDEVETSFEMTGTVAYDRQKVMESKFMIGEGLVGRCAYEKLTIYMEEVPEDYVHITSGLGESNPRSILLVPAILNDEVFAIIELVSFNKFEEYQIHFIEKLGESIASTIQNVRTAQRTNMLLEQTKQQAEEMAAQEEEMRQNLEELQATQEEMGRLRDEEKAKMAKIEQEIGKRNTTFSHILDKLEWPTFLASNEGDLLLSNKLFNNNMSQVTEMLSTGNLFIYESEKAEKPKKVALTEICNAHSVKSGYLSMDGTPGNLVKCKLHGIYIEQQDAYGVLGFIDSTV